jgi:hypothetical protein
MAAGRDPVDRVIDLVVAVPVSIVAAARQLMPVRVTRLEHRVARDLDLIVRYAKRAVPSRARRFRSHDAGPTTTITSAERSVADTEGVGIAWGDAEIERVETDAALAGAAVDELPIEGYDQLSARQIVDRLGALTSSELALIEEHEQRRRRRQTILLRIAQLT